MYCLIGIHFPLVKILSSLSSALKYFLPFLITLGVWLHFDLGSFLENILDLQVSNLFPEAKSVGRWVKEGWHVTVAYILGFIAIMLIWGWHPIHIPN